MNSGYACSTSNIGVDPVAEWLNNEGQLHLFDFDDVVHPVTSELHGAGYSNVHGHGNSY